MKRQLIETDPDMTYILELASLLILFWDIKKNMHMMNAQTKKLSRKIGIGKKEPNENPVIKCTIPEIKLPLDGITEDWEKIKVSDLDRSVEITQSEKVEKEILENEASLSDW